MFERLIQPHLVWAHPGTEAEGAGSGGEAAGKGRRVQETVDGTALGSAKPGDLKADIHFPEGGGGGPVTHAVQGDRDLRGGGSR